MQYHVDGELVAAGEASVPATDSGFLYGAGATLDLRAFGGSLFAPDDHLSSLTDTCDRLRIDPPADILDRCRETLAANDLEDAHLRVVLSRGGLRRVRPGFEGWNWSDREATGGRPDEEADRTGEPTVVVTVRGLPRGGLSGGPPWDGPAALQTVKVRRADDRAIPGGTTASVLPSVLAGQELYEGADEALLKGPDGTVVGGTASNLFFVAEDGLHTPTAASVPPGVVRSMILEFAEGSDLPVHESAPDPGAVREASEVFLTGSIGGVRPVETVDGIDVGSGPVCELLRRQYLEYVERNHYS